MVTIVNIALSSTQVSMIWLHLSLMHCVAILIWFSSATAVEHERIFEAENIL